MRGPAHTCGTERPDDWDIKNCESKNCERATTHARTERRTGDVLPLLNGCGVTASGLRKGPADRAHPVDDVKKGQFHARARRLVYVATVCCAF